MCVCSFCGKPVLKSFLLTDSLDLLSAHRPRETTELTLRNNNTVDFLFSFFFSRLTQTHLLNDSCLYERVSIIESSFLVFFNSIRHAETISVVLQP